jgi:hypothetical protein
MQNLPTRARSAEEQVMGRHSGPSNEDGHGRDVYWHEDASDQAKADNFDAYHDYLVENAPEDDSNPYRKQ